MIFSILTRKPRKTLSPKRVGEVYEQKGIAVLRRCQLILRDDALAEDALQDVFESLARYGAEFEDREVPLAWLYRTAERCCFAKFNKKKKEPVPMREGSTYEPSSNNMLLSTEAVEIIDRFFYGLDPKLKQVALLYYVDGLTQERIAEQLNWSRRTVGTKIGKLRKRAERLRNEIEKKD